jgi:hypothetical protein
VDKGVAQGVKIPLKIKKSSKYKGSILVNAEKAEVTAQSDSDVIDYEIIVKNSTELAGEEKNSGGGSASGECGAYWVIGDINCSGGKPDEKDYQAWKAAFSPHIDGGAASLPECTSAGNINADVNSDGKVDLKDFEVWRKGANGTQTNPAMTQWPEACR